jgi:predicted phosphodiesterase
VELFDTDADVIIIAGDTSNRPERTFAFLEMVADTYPTKHVIATFGNHEYYAGDFMDINYDVIRYIDKNERKNLHILHDTYVVIDDVAFFGSVFWTAFNLFDPISNRRSREDADKNFSDYYSIFYGIVKPKLEDLMDNPMLGVIPVRNPLTTKITMKAHDYAIKQIKGFIKHFEGKKRVVITHHSPSPKSIHPQYDGDLVNNCFHSNREDLMGTGIDIWVHGHTHHSYDYTIEDTRVICNPRGYGHENTYGFNDRLVVEI